MAALADPVLWGCGGYGGGVQRRIFGIENEYGVTCTLRGQRRLSPDEVARYLFRKVVSWGRSSNVFLGNGSRLYLDVGSHPEYATPECDSAHDLVVHDKAGERIVERLLGDAEERLAEEGIRGDVFLFKNNTDSAGNSYGCHENYLTSRRDDLSDYAEVLIPFLVSRQIYAGAGKVLQTARGAMYCISQRAEHIWEGVSSATTTSRGPIINTRDEPHADAERFRRLHVIVGDSNMSEYTTFLKVGACALMLRMLEDPRVVLRDMTLENPIRAIREISHDITCRRRVRLATGREVSALDIQSEYLNRALRYAEHHDLSDEEKKALTMWEYCLTAIEQDPLQLDREVDWVIKHHLVDRLPRAARTWISPTPGSRWWTCSTTTCSQSRGLLLRCMQHRGMVETLVTEAEIHHAVENRSAVHHPGPAAGRVHPPGQGAPPRLHRRLGAPEAQRPVAAHGAVQGSVQVPRRAGGEADRVPLATGDRVFPNDVAFLTTVPTERDGARGRPQGPQILAMDKFERLLNLTAALLHTEQPLSANELRERMAGAYSENKVAFRRTFERDKADLRAIGVPIEVSTLYRLDPPVNGYRIPRDRYAGRDLRFEPDELAVLHLATNLVRLEGGAGTGLARLGGAASPGADTEAVEAVGELPFHDSLSKLVAAAIGRRAVSFSYRDVQRLVEPWRLSFHRGHWYVVGWDTDQSDDRLFRVDRIDGEVTEEGPAANPVGEGSDPRAVKPWEFGAGEPVEARVLVDADQAAWACHHAGVDGERKPDGSVVITLKVRNTDAFRTFVVEFLEHAEVLDPPWLRDDFVTWLEALADPS